MLRVLLAEADRRVQFAWKYDLKETKIEVIQAYTIKETLQRFAMNQDVALIVIAGFIPSVVLDSEPLVEAIRITYKGPMIAAHAIPAYREELVVAGCDYQCHKLDVPKLVRDLLEL